MNANSFAYLRLLHGPEKAQELLGRRLLNLDYYQLDLEDIRILIDADADVNAKNESGWTPLHACIDDPDLKVLQALIDAGADVNAKDEDGWAPLHYVADSTCRHLEALQALIDAGADVNVKSERGVTPLHYACIDDSDLKVLQALINAGADVNAKNEDGKTPLYYAMEEDLPGDYLKILINAGADVEEAIMCWQSQYEHPSLYGRSLLHYAVVEMDSEPEILQSLVDSGADVNEKNRHGCSLLHYALKVDSEPETLKVLLDAGADVEVEDVERDTPLHVAARRSPNLETLRSLINAGSVGWVNVWGMTPLHYAARDNSNPEVLRVLIDAGADVGASNGGRTCMRINLHTGEKDFVDPCNSSMLLLCLKEFYLPNGIDLKLLPESFYCDVVNDEIPDFEDSIRMSRSEGVDVWVDPQEPWDGRTPLHHAARDNSNPEVLRVLTDAGADINAEDVDGHTPLDLAKSNKNPEISKLLIDLGAKANVKPES